jgi:hypothetical protein
MPDPSWALQAETYWEAQSGTGVGVSVVTTVVVSVGITTFHDVVAKCHPLAQSSQACFTLKSTLATWDDQQPGRSGG